MKPVLIDTGVIVALLDRDEKQHQACVRALESVTVPLITCEAVIAECCYLLRSVNGAADSVLENVARGVFQIPFQLSRDVSGVQRILRKYRDQEIDLADACLIHLANELGTSDVLTLDSDFEIYRWGTANPFRLLIPLRPAGRSSRR